MSKSMMLKYFKMIAKVAFPAMVSELGGGEIGLGDSGCCAFFSRLRVSSLIILTLISVYL